MSEFVVIDLIEQRAADQFERVQAALADGEAGLEVAQQATADAFQEWENAKTLSYEAREAPQHIWEAAKAAERVAKRIYEEARSFDSLIWNRLYTSLWIKIDGAERCCIVPTNPDWGRKIPLHNLDKPHMLRWDGTSWEVMAQ